MPLLRSATSSQSTSFLIPPSEANRSFASADSRNRARLTNSLPVLSTFEERFRMTERVYGSPMQRKKAAPSAAVPRPPPRQSDPARPPGASIRPSSSSTPVILPTSRPPLVSRPAGRTILDNLSIPSRSSSAPISRRSTPTSSSAASLVSLPSQVRETSTSQRRPSPILSAVGVPPLPIPTLSSASSASSASSESSPLSRSSDEWPMRRLSEVAADLTEQFNEGVESLLNAENLGRQTNLMLLAAEEKRATSEYLNAQIALEEDHRHLRAPYFAEDEFPPSPRLPGTPLRDRTGSGALQASTDRKTRARNPMLEWSPTESEQLRVSRSQFRTSQNNVPDHLLMSTSQNNLAAVFNPQRSWDEKHPLSPRLPDLAAAAAQAEANQLKDAMLVHFEKTILRMQVDAETAAGDAALEAFDAAKATNAQVFGTVGANDVELVTLRETVRRLREQTARVIAETARMNRSTDVGVRRIAEQAVEKQQLKDEETSLREVLRASVVVEVPRTASPEPEMQEMASVAEDITVILHRPSPPTSPAKQVALVTQVVAKELICDAPVAHMDDSIEESLPRSSPARSDLASSSAIEECVLLVEPSQVMTREDEEEEDIFPSREPPVQAQEQGVVEQAVLEEAVLEEAVVEEAVVEETVVEEVVEQMTVKEETMMLVRELKLNFSDARNLEGVREFLDERHDADQLARDLLTEAIERLMQKAQTANAMWSRRHGPGTSRPVKKEADLSWASVEQELQEIFEFENVAPDSSRFMQKMVQQILGLDSKSRSLAVDTENYERFRAEIVKELQDDIMSDLIEQEIRAVLSAE